MSNETRKEFLEIAKLVSNENESVINEVLACINDTQNYFEANEEQYEERGIDDAEDVELIQWIGLVSILEKYNFVCERDWKDEKDDFIYFVQNLAGTKLNHLPINQEWFNEEDDITEWCSILDEKWRSQGMCVAAFDIESDSYVLFPCRVTDLEKLNDCAEQIGYSIDLVKNM